MKKTSIKFKLISLVISSILIVSVIVLIESNTALNNTSKIITEKFEKDAFSSKEKELKDYVQIALNTIEIFHEKSLKDPKNEQQYKLEALNAIKKIRYGKDGYFWINDSQPKMIMHPIQEELVGQDMSDYQDVDGVYIFREMAKLTSGGKNAGLVRYKTKKTNSEEVFAKFSYVIKFQPWDWIIGTGAYVDNISASINNIKKVTKESIIDTITINIISIIATILILCFIVLFIARKVIFSPLENFQNGLLNFFKYLNGESKEVTLLNNTSTDEIGLMSKVVNEGIQKVQETITQKYIDEWINDGVNKLNQILINEKEIQNVSDASINFICTHINAGVGVFYLFEESTNKLTQYASYAHVIRDELSNEFNLKEGIVGQVAFQKKPILLKNIKKDENLITTGTLTQASYNTYTFPLIYNNELFGVIEIGSFEEISSKFLKFFDATNKIICLALSNAIQDKKVKELLENTKIANRQLEDQQIQLQEANAQMEERGKSSLANLSSSNLKKPMRTWKNSSNNLKKPMRTWKNSSNS